MWNADKYTRVASFYNDELHFHTDYESVVYLLDFGGSEVYVGSTSNLKARVQQHASKLRNMKHTDFMQRAFNRTKAFSVYVLLHLPNADETCLKNAESSLIHLIQPKLNTQKWEIKSTLAPNGLVYHPTLNNKGKTEFVATINTSDGIQTPHTLKRMLSIINKEYHEEFVEHVLTYFFGYTYFANYFRNLKIRNKAIELYNVMRRNNINFGINIEQ